MKNQNDLIFSIVAILIFGIVIGVAFGTKKEPVQPGAPTPVNLAPPQLPANVNPILATSLPGASNQQNGGGGAAAGGRAVGAAGPGAAAGGGGPVTVNPATR